MTNTSPFPIKPLGNNIVVKPLGVSDRTQGGLFLPGTTADRNQFGIILQVGPGKFTPKGKIPMELKIGDRVFFDQHSGQELTIGTNRYIMLTEDEVQGKVIELQPEDIVELKELQAQIQTSINFLEQRMQKNEPASKLLNKASTVQEEVRTLPGGAEVITVDFSKRS